MQANFKVILPLLVTIFIATETQAMRWYSANTGRWLSRGPLGDAVFLTQVLQNSRTADERKDLRLEALAPAYVMVKNDPLSLVDYLGLAVVTKNSDGTFTVKVQTCEFVCVVDHGFASKNSYTFVFPSSSKHPSAAGFAGCYATDVNHAISKLIPGAPSGGEWDGTISPYYDGPTWNAGIKALRDGAVGLAKSSLSSCPCGVTLTFIGAGGQILTQVQVKTASDADKFHIAGD